MWELQSKSPFHRIKSWYSNRRRLSLWLNDDQIFSVYISFLFFSLLRHKNQLLSDLRACLIARIVLTQNTDNNLSIFVTTQLLMNIVSIICCTLTFKSSEIKYRSRMTVYVFSIDNFCFFLEMKKKENIVKPTTNEKRKSSLSISNPRFVQWRNASVQNHTLPRNLIWRVNLSRQRFTYTFYRFFSHPQI